MVAIEGLRKLSLNELLGKLHEAISAVAKNLGRLTERNRELSLVDVIELRNHIKERFAAKQDTVQNKKLLKLIELFKDDKNAIEMMRIDVSEWLDFLDAIKSHIEQNMEGASKNEAADLEKLKQDITRLQGALRRA